MQELSKWGLRTRIINNTQLDYNIYTKWVKNKSVLKEHGNNGYNYAKKNFDRDFISQYYLEQLKKVV